MFFLQPVHGIGSGFFCPCSQGSAEYDLQQPARSRVPWWVGVSSIGAGDQPPVHCLILY